ncbi:MAG TPA: transglutaminase domain-containing protein [Vicinamibacteria bacterium]|nr:transglutaminase domain-containing protein [Vicinamibacteria bacterium]
MARVILDGLWLLLVLLVTGAGMWLSSSLAAYLNGPVWLAAGLGVLAFPVLPLLWEARAAMKRARTRSLRQPFFTVWDRIVLRTLAVNLALVCVLLARWPTAAFAALATRGDWFLEGRHSQEARAARVVLFRTAGGIEWLYRAAHHNPNDAYLARTKTPEGEPQPVPVPMADGAARPSLPSVDGGSASPMPSADVAPSRPTEVAPEAPDVPQRLGDGTPVWPLPAQVHPAVAALPVGAESSIASVARYIVQQEPDPWMRIKALHDYVADRVSYDVEAYRSKTYPPQDAETVFRTRRSVCAGYANLLAAMGSAAGDEIVVVGGDSRSNGRDLTGEGHAWNAARIGGRWTLLDATWDAGAVTEGRFVKRYSTEFLFTPPEIQGLSHFPDEDRWQLRHPALSRGEFLRQPLMRPRFYAEGFTLVSPDRPQVTVDRLLEALIRNPRHRYVIARYERRDGAVRADCDVEQGPSVSVRCALPDEGTYRVVLLSNREEYGTYLQIGEIEALRGSGR